VGTQQFAEQIAFNQGLVIETKAFHQLAAHLLIQSITNSAKYHKTTAPLLMANNAPNLDREYLVKTSIK
jgi:hypothetical protein